MHFVVPSANKKMQAALLTTASTFKENQLDEDKRKNPYNKNLFISIYFVY